MNEYLVTQLKKGRLSKGYKQSDVTLLTGIKNTTLSNYENGVTEPDFETFFRLCRLYGLDYSALLGEAYGLPCLGSGFSMKPSEIEAVKKYRALDGHGKKMVDFTLTEEYLRCAVQCGRQEALISFPSPPETVAAHERTDIPVTENMRAQDDKLMEDENW